MPAVSTDPVTTSLTADSSQFHSLRVRGAGSAVVPSPRASRPSRGRASPTRVRWSRRRWRGRDLRRDEHGLLVGAGAVLRIAPLGSGTRLHEARLPRCVNGPISTTCAFGASSGSSPLSSRCWGDNVHREVQFVPLSTGLATVRDLRPRVQDDHVDRRHHPAALTVRQSVDAVADTAKVAEIDGDTVPFSSARGVSNRPLQRDAIARAASRRGRDG